MKLITLYLLRFALIAAILTIVFRGSLSYWIDQQQELPVILSSVIYGSLMFIAGWVFGKKDHAYLPFFDLGFRFHFTTYLVHNVISLLWVGLGIGSELESFSIVMSVALYWGVFLVIHFVVFLMAKKRTIDNLNKEDIFE